MTKAAIFDMDGTLVDSFYPHWLSWKAIADENHIEYTRSMYDKSFGRQFKSIVEMFWRKEGKSVNADGSPLFSDEQLKTLEQRKEELYRDIFRDNFVLMPGADSFIRRLKAAGYKMAIGSSGPRENIQMVIELMHAESIFDTFVSCDEVSRCKPDPEIFLTAAEKLGVTPAQCCVFEDSDAGVQAAVNAAMKCVAIYKPDYQYATLSNANRKIQTFDDLSVQYIDQLIEKGV